MSTSRTKPGAFDFDCSGYEPLPKPRGLFVTGTDTDVGKTLVGGAIAQALRRAGRGVEVFKPVASGCRKAREGLVSADAEFLAACAESRRTLREINPVRYASALAPNVAARREDRPVDLDAIFDAYRRLADSGDFVIVEGVGGLLCPITDDFWVVHLARLMGLPLVVVARSGLGTINHTLLTLHAARGAGLHVAGVVVNRYPPRLRQMVQGVEYPACPDADVAILTNPQQIAERGKVRVLALVPDEPGNSVANATLGPETQLAVAQVDWSFGQT